MVDRAWQWLSILFWFKRILRHRCFIGRVLLKCAFTYDSTFLSWLTRRTLATFRLVKINCRTFLRRFRQFTVTLHSWFSLTSLVCSYCSLRTLSNFALDRWRKIYSWSSFDRRLRLPSLGRNRNFRCFGSNPGWFFNFPFFWRVRLKFTLFNSLSWWLCSLPNWFVRFRSNLTAFVDKKSHIIL
jgi:hypothetical protein